LDKDAYACRNDRWPTKEATKVVQKYSMIAQDQINHFFEIPEKSDENFQRKAYDLYG